MTPRKQNPVTWWQGIVLATMLGGVVQVTSYLVHRADDGDRDQLTDIHARLSALEAKCH